jgi:hypothetical protein
MGDDQQLPDHEICEGSARVEREILWKLGYNGGIK